MVCGNAPKLKTGRRLSNLTLPSRSTLSAKLHFHSMMSHATTQREEIRAAAAQEEPSDRFYSFAKLDHYNFKQRLIIRFAGVALYWIVRSIGATLKFEVEGWEHHTDSEPLVYCFWHNRIPIATYFWRRRGIVVMSSQSFDSEYIARF